MTYSALLAFANSITPGDKQSAARMLDQITHLLDTGSEDLTFDGRRYLYKIRKRWETRAAGADPRWNSKGTKPGRGTQASAKRNTAVRNEEESDPLLARIIRKFGTPLPEDL